MRVAIVVIAAFSATLAAGPAAGQPVEPGQEGALAGILAPDPGGRICYERAYSSDHLAKHPQQRVTAMSFRLAYVRHEPDEFWPKGQRNYYFAMTAKRRGEAQTLTTFGECSPNGDAIACGVECDGGGVTVAGRPPDKILVRLGADGRIRMSEGCDAEDDAVDLEGGADDHEFLLTRSADCPTYDDW